MAILFAHLLNFKFLDAANYIIIKKNGLVDEVSTRANFAKLPRNERYVMGGFYGCTEVRPSKTCPPCRNNLKVKTFTRGGSDYSGAIAAVYLNARLYENFTDTYGVQTANPAIVKETLSIPEIDYSTLYRLCKAGASVIYPNCVPLLRRHSMPLKVDCTLDPGKRYTIVGLKRAQSPYFSITYETKRNINKDTVEILCIMNKISFSYDTLCEMLSSHEVYLVSFSKHEFRLIASVSAFVEVINLLHKSLIAAKSIASL